MATVALRSWHASALTWLAFTIAGVIVLPLLYICFLALTADSAVWSRLWTTRIPELLSNTVWLAMGTTVGTLLLGVPSAYIISRFEFWGRSIWEWALVLPLALPSYVLAYIYSFLLGFDGPIEHLWQLWAGPDARIFSPFSFFGATLVMTLNNFPFVYLLTRAALLNFNVSYEEVAKACGASSFRVITAVTLPLLRPALVAGLSLVLLYVVSDFGAVSLLRYQTLTYAVYQQITGRYDPTAASILSLLLVGLALTFLFAERWFRQRSRFFQTTGRFRAPSRKPCTWITGLASMTFLSTIFLAAFGLPVFMLISWTFSAIGEGTLDSRFFGFAWNSAFLSAMAATGAVLIGIPLAYLVSRHPTRLNLFIVQLSYTGYVLPGPVGALALLILISTFVPILYGGVSILIIAYIIHFLPAGLQAMEPAIHQVTPNLEEVSRSLGRNLWQTLKAVTLPLVRKGFIVAWVLMFIQAMKELPATLLLRPVGFDTLAIRVWLEASEELYHLAAPAALLIVLVTLPALMLLISKDWRQV